MSKLVCLAGMNKGDQFPLHEGRNSIGRDGGSNIVLFDKQCSRQHCVIHKRGHLYSVEDLDSSNGTVVAGKIIGKHKPTPCEPGARIKVGQTVLMLSERGVGNVVERTATDVAEDLQGKGYDKLMKDATISLANLHIGGNRKESGGFLKSLFKSHK